ncbi:MAG: ferredoxin [Arcobacter sp.]|uniref:2Fe-2S iron-sulfur cluster binding domain-containing protein n=1 Tax=uncultured Arcobacter sp. TaxID=165434 RepID=UPI000CC7ED69|nr:2Fe-2S iron-sulfur cluster binding domain-containing protein [uncultured Arcobacter sp.]PLY11553.1 MAG: ferredoxin [Arcobacter sp.]
MKHNILVRDKNKNRECFENKNLMDSLSKQSDLAPKGCHNGCCGVCKVIIHNGDYEKLKMNRKHISEVEENENTVLACRVFPKSDMEIEFIPRTKTNVEKDAFVFGK